MLRAGLRRSLAYEEDTVVIFELTEEDRYQSVLIYVVNASLLQKNICFVEQQYGLPCHGVIEDFFQFDF